LTDRVAVPGRSQLAVPEPKARKRFIRAFFDDRANLQLATDQPARLAPMATRPGCEISYLTGTPVAATEPAAAAQEQRELPAGDPIERRVVWSMTEAGPISASPTFADACGP
jgi:hypothetical protein